MVDVCDRRIINDTATTEIYTLSLHDALPISVVAVSLKKAKSLEKGGLADPCFVCSEPYPNGDFYSGIIYRAMGIPTNMFTVMFALGRLPGWLAHWKEMRDDPKTRINRPRQIYTGAPQRKFVPLEERG